ncbi:unnamed protein product [Rotaria sordida]|uniref:Uncharacterized protein n=1 Tax=Rotaria sordida TaxID=392033 RepID=A0A819RX46_9BILA|nr:unnamed protein product [Rotaria sordida]
MSTTSIANTKDETLREVIEATGRYRYHIKYEGVKISHMLHVLVAQHQLGASDNRLREIADILGEKLEPAHTKDPSHEPITHDTWQTLMGKQIRFIELAEFFDKELDDRFNGDKKALLVEYLPQLIDGMSAIATHGIIHLGYALRSPSKQSIADALALMVFSYKTLGHMNANKHQIIEDNESSIDPYVGCNELVQLLKFVQKDAVDLALRVTEESGGKSLYGYFSRHMSVLHSHPEMQEKLQTYARRITTIERVRDNQLMDLSHALSVACLLAYDGTISEPDNFFLLHGVTSSWALREVLRYLKDEINPTLLRSILYAHVLTILAVYIIEDMPDITLRNGQMPLFNIHSDDNNNSDLPNWSDIIKLAIDSDDDHLPKLVFSCYDDEEHYGVPIPNIYRLTSARKVGLLEWN